jgi:hypothetical protein
VPTPSTIPPLPKLNNPTTVGPGTHGVVGNGVTDDTAAWQTLLNAGDVIVQSGTYAIAGSLTIPTGRNIQCQAGATFYDVQINTTHMFLIGWGNPASTGNNSISGCTFAGTDTPSGPPTNYANSIPSSGGYTELFDIAQSGGVVVNNVLLYKNHFKDGQGDELIIYSNCGPPVASSWQCNGLTPGTEGPNNIVVYNNTFDHCSQPGLHVNGGQNIHLANNAFTDCNGYDEEDPGTLQVMIGIYWNNNTYQTSQYGDGGAGSLGSCMGSDYIASNGTGCWFVNNTLTGATSGGSGTQLFEGNTSCASGTFKPGNYSGNVVNSGAWINTGC